MGGVVGRGTFVRREIAVRASIRTTAPVPGAVAAASMHANVIEFSINTPTDLDSGGEYNGMMNATLRALSESTSVGGLLNYQSHGGNRAHRDVAAHIGAAADFAADEAAPFRFAIGARHGADGAAQPIGQLAVGGQAVAGRKPALPDVGGQRIRNRQIARSTVGGNVGEPNCHGNNVSVDR
jgi:hypothetical protein